MRIMEGHGTLNAIPFACDEPAHRVLWDLKEGKGTREQTDVGGSSPRADA